MTRECFKRCTHCRSEYLCLISGQYGYSTNHTDGRYCPDCLEVVTEALRSVPPKFERAWVDATDVSLEQILAWKRLEDEDRAKARAEGRLVAERVVFPLFDLSGKRKSCQGIVKGRDEFAGRVFEFRYWTSPESDISDITIREEVERNLVTGAIRPWRSL